MNLRDILIRVNSGGNGRSDFFRSYFTPRESVLTYFKFTKKLKRIKSRRKRKRIIKQIIN